MDGSRKRRCNRKTLVVVVQHGLALKTTDVKLMDLILRKRGASVKEATCT